MKKKNILLCVAGMTPQIVTETLYALTVQPNDPQKRVKIHETDWDFLLDLVSWSESTRKEDYELLMESLSRSIGRANKKLRKAGMPGKYQIAAKGPKGRPRRYGLDLEKGQIQFAQI